MGNLVEDILQSVKFKSAVYFKHGFCKPWGMDVGQSAYAQFHLVAGGHCILQLKDGLHELEKGDIVIFPKGSPHQIKDSLTTTCSPGKALVADILQNGPQVKNTKADAHLICGHYEIDYSYSHPILDELPEQLIIKSSEYGRFAAMHTYFEMIVEEMSARKPAYETVSLRLAEVLFIAAIRYYYLQQSKEKLNIFKDVLIFEALNLIHQAPESTWSIEKLCRQVGISRTLFINRFKDAVGLTPMKYVKHWRLLKAKELLKSTDLSLVQIGEQIGFDSETSFHRAFKQEYDLTPGKFRKMEADH